MLFSEVKCDVCQKVESIKSSYPPAWTLIDFTSFGSDIKINCCDNSECQAKASVSVTCCCCGKVKVERQLYSNYNIKINGPDYPSGWERIYVNVNDPNNPFKTSQRDYCDSNICQNRRKDDERLNQIQLRFDPGF